MKVSLKSVLKTSYSQFECLEDQQIVFRAGNTLCIKEIARNECSFICLSKQMQHLFSFKSANNKKSVFTAQKHQQQIQIANYDIQGERKSLSLADEGPFFTQAEAIELLVDEYDNNLVYGIARGRDTDCVFLVDIAKAKLLATGYMPRIQDIKVDSRENMTLSVCGHNGSHNFVKCLRYGIGQWEIQEQNLKKMQGIVFHHELLFGGRVLMVSRTALFVFEETELIQTVQLKEEGEQIEQVLKIPHGLIARLSDERLKYYVEDAEESTFTAIGYIQLQHLPDDRIKKMQLSHNTEQVILRTIKNNLYIWRCQNTSQDSDNSCLTFTRVESSSDGGEEGTISISSNKKYCLMCSARNVTLWSIQRNQFVLSSQFSSPQQPQKRTIFSGAINPDGSTVMIAFEDRIKLYKILLTKFKYYSQFGIKRSRQIIYSHGGQLAACRFGKGNNASITIVNLIRLTQVCTLKIQSDPLQIVWNQLDDELIVSTENKSIQVYKVSDSMRILNIKLDDGISHLRLDYKTKRIIISTQNHKIISLEGDKIVEVVSPPIKDFQYMFPLYGVYFIVGRSGVLYWSYSPKFQTIHEIPLFTQRPFHLICRNSYLIAYSSFQDITVLHCARTNVVVKKPSGQDLVLVQKDQILNFFDKMRTIQNNFELLQSSTQNKLQQERHNYASAVQTFKEQYLNELKFSNTKFGEMVMSKLKQERQNEKVFQTLQMGQVKNVQQLQMMYDRKYALQKQKYMQLQQNSLQQKLRYERLICELQIKYHKEVAAIRESYANQLKKQNRCQEDIKNNNLQKTQWMQAKLIQLQEQNQFALLDIQNSKNAIIQTLQARCKQLEELYQKAGIALHNQKKDMKSNQEETSKQLKQLKIMNQKLAESYNRIQLLEHQINKLNLLIEEKQQIVAEQTHQILGLEKAKYVLSFRTTEIRKQLQPKQAMTDKLKSELFKLDEEFKEEKKRNFELSQSVNKLQIINEAFKRQNSDLKISLKYKEGVHYDLCSQIFMIINTVDPKDWNGSFIKLYQTHIKEEKHKSNLSKKRDDTSEQLNRHLVHVEQSLIHVTNGTERIMKHKDKEVVRKMKENSDLVYQLNVMRKNQTQSIKKQKLMITQIARLKRELSETYKSTSRSLTAKTGITRRVIASKQGLSRQKTTILDISELQTSKRDDAKTSIRERSRIASAHRTLMVRDDKRQKNNKFFDLAKQLQTARTTIRRQDRMIEQLNNRLMGMPEQQN